MAHDGWAAALTDGGAEYAVKIDLERLGLNPYCPQVRRRWKPPGSSTFLVRSFPLFPKHVLLPVDHARTRAVHYVKGLKTPRAFIDDAAGKMLTLPADAVFELWRLEMRGDLDETLLAGNWVRMTGVDLFLAQAAEETARLFGPLVSGASATPGLPLAAE